MNNADTIVVYKIKWENGFVWKINQGGITMPGMKGIYRINPALLGGIIGITMCLMKISPHTRDFSHELGDTI